MPRGIPRNNSTQRKVLHRMKIARGHLDKIISMTEKDEYCLDIVHQSKALQAALKQIDNLILENHLSTCVAHDMQHGHVQKAVDEVISVIKKA